MTHEKATDTSIVHIRPIDGTLDSVVRLPGSKSLVNRALIIAALAEGESRLSGVGWSDDIEAMTGCVTALGATIRVDGDVAQIEGTAGRVRRPEQSLDARMSGTTARFVLPLLGLAGAGTLTAHPQMQARPMAPLVDAMRQLGSAVSTDVLPIEVTSGFGNADRCVIDAGVSSQFISALLMVAPCLDDGLRLDLHGDAVSQPYIDMTVSLMRAFGAGVAKTPEGFDVAPGGYRGGNHLIEPDASTATYPLAAAAIVGGRVVVDGLGHDSIQGDAGFADVLRSMGARVWVDADRTEVRGSGILRPIDVNLGDMSDTAPTFAALAARADGESRATGIGFIRTTKESDRVAASVTELRRLGIDAEVEEDGYRVTGGPHERVAVETYEDHRMAMSLALLGLVEPGIDVVDPGCADKTFPGFWDLLDQLRAEARTTPLVLAIDGPAGSGKSTVAAAVADRLHLPHLDTGAMYRSVALAVLRSGVSIDNHAAVTAAAERSDIRVGGGRVLVDGEDVSVAIRTPEVTSAVSPVAAIHGVRAILADQQRSWARRRGAAVIEGRDIGTAIFPDATCKIFLTASVEERARRRAAETGDVDLDDMMQRIAERDRIDSTREHDPLVQADDAMLLDSTGMTIDGVIDQVADHWERVVDDGPGGMSR